MIRIGFSRWNVLASAKSGGSGNTIYEFGLIPHALNYIVLKDTHSDDTKSVASQNFVSVMTIPTYNTRMASVVTEIAKITDTLASDAINFCYHNGMIGYEGFDKDAAFYIVKNAIMKAVSSGNPDPIEQIELADIACDLIELRREQESLRTERERVAREAWIAHEEDRARRNAIAEPARKRSFEFLDKVLTKDERETLRSKKYIHIKNVYGDFFVTPVSSVLVEQFVNGKYIASHCIMFEDYSLPIGDEIAMKVALLKANPEKFLKTANKFIRKPTKCFALISAQSNSEGSGESSFS